MGQFIEPPSALDQIFNLLPNSRAEVSQRGDAGIVTALTAARQIGSVDCCAMWASGGAVAAGNISQATGTLVGSSGEAARAAGVTLTGAGQLSFALRMEQRDAELYKNRVCAFQVAVAHDAGATVNYTVIIKKANAADNWAAMTTIATSAAIPIQTATGTILKFENVAIGDCSNGIEIEVQAACGAIAAKNFDFTEWALTIGITAPAFAGQSFTYDLLQCQRYLPFLNYALATQMLEGVATSTTTSRVRVTYLPTLRPVTGASSINGGIALQITATKTGTSGFTSVPNVVNANHTQVLMQFATILNVPTIAAGDAVSLDCNAATCLYFTGAELF